jgi:[DsrC]-trisulfide reductase subunit J
MLKKSLIILLLGFSAALALQVRAGDSILPEIPAAQARFSATQGCVEPTEDMRRNHMKYLLHKRDLTMHEGIRTRQYSLKVCINCHVSAAQDAPRVSSEKHFCNSCHTYAAVEIDCFQCHADRPGDSAQGSSLSSRSNPHQKTSAGNPDDMKAGNLHVLASEGNVHE